MNQHDFDQFRASLPQDMREYLDELHEDNDCPKCGGSTRIMIPHLESWGKCSCGDGIWRKTDADRARFAAAVRDRMQPDLDDDFVGW